MPYTRRSALAKNYTAYQKDLAICQELGDSYGEATTLNNIGPALQDQGRSEHAITSAARCA